MRLTKLLTILFALVLPLFISTTPTLAADPFDYKKLINDSSSNLLKIYCQRRTGTQLNLETWYGGRCNATNPADTIGFGDIILLDIMEKLTGTPDDGMKTVIETIFKLKSNATYDEKINILAQSAPPSSNGVISELGNQITNLYKSPPASSIDYLAYINSNLSNKNIIKPAYAQLGTTGYGYQAVKPILPIWRAFRNLAYLLFIIAFIIYGIFIMFRMKIGSQTAISIETAIPNLVFSLIIITFSYAIAGFLIDLFYVFTGFIFSILVSVGFIKNMGLASIVNGSSGGLFWSFVMAQLQLLLGWSGRIIAGVLNIPSWLGHLVTFIGLITTWGFFFWLILAIAIVVTYMKVFWMLLQAYVSVLLDIIFSPIILLGTLLPGSKSFSNWLTRIFANLSIFTSTMLMFTMAFYFLGGFFLGWGSIGELPTSGSGDGIWQPYPLFSGDGLGEIEGKYAVLGFGILLMTPKIADMVKKALNVQDINFGSAIMETMQESYSKASQYNTWAQANKGTHWAAGGDNWFQNSGRDIASFANSLVRPKKTS